MEERTLIARSKVEGAIRGQGGKFITVTFKKKDGTLRVLNGRMGVYAYSKGGESKVSTLDKPYLTVWDTKIKEYRSVNLDTVIGFKAGGKTYSVVD